MTLSLSLSRGRAIAAVAIAALTLAAPLRVPASPPEFRLTAPLLGDQGRPHLALSPTGGWLVWQDNAVTPHGLRIRAQALTPDGAPAGDALVASSLALKKTTGQQENPQVTMLDDGGALLVWQSGTPGKQYIYSRLLRPDGTFAAKRDLRVSDARPSKSLSVNESSPAVAKLTDGSLVVVWSDVARDGSMQGVFAQRLTAAGLRMGPSFAVNQYSLYNQRSPAVAALTSGNFVVTWVSELQRGEASVDVYARLFNASGIALNNEFHVNTSVTNSCANPSVVALADGGFAVAWSQQDAPTRGRVSNLIRPTDGNVGDPGTTGFTGATRSTRGWDIWGRLYSGSGVAVTLPSTWNSHTYGDQFAPRLAAVPAGTLAVWTSLGQDGAWEGIYGQFISANCQLLGDEFRVNQTTVSRQIQPQVAVAADGSGVVVWSSFGAGTSFDLFGRRCSAPAAQ